MNTMLQDCPPAKSVAEKTTLDYLLLAAQTFLVLSLLANLIVASIGYYILPDQVVSRANPDYGSGLRNAYSKEYFLAVMTGSPVVMFLIAFLFPLQPSKRTETTENTDYWDRAENAVLKRKITGFWIKIVAGIMILYITLLLIWHFSVNLSTPPRGNAVPLFSIVILCSSGLLVPVLSYCTLVITRCTLAITKRS